MRNLIVRTSAVLTFALCSFATFSPAQAHAPAECASPREVRFFQLGERKGASLARQARNTLGDIPEICDDGSLDDLQQLALQIVDDLVLPPAPSQAAQCHVLGQISGLLAELEGVQEECDGACILDGTFIGELSALLYCELSVALGGLALDELFTRLDTTRCGENFEDACDEAFEEVAASDLECAPFTEDTFTEVFEQTQNNQCAHNPL